MNMDNMLYGTHTLGLGAAGGGGGEGPGVEGSIRGAPTTLTVSKRSLFTEQGLEGVLRALVCAVWPAFILYHAYQRMLLSQVES